jgi:hypothetical protein
LKKRTVDLRLLVAYFIIGGLIISVVTYLGSRQNSLLAAFIAFFPGTSVITLVTIYLAAGTVPSVSYAKSMLILLPAWVLYVLGIIFLLPRLGLVASILISVAVYTGAALLTMKLT